MSAQKPRPKPPSHKNLKRRLAAAELLIDCLKDELSYQLYLEDEYLAHLTAEESANELHYREMLEKVLGRQHSWTGYRVYNSYGYGYRKN